MSLARIGAALSGRGTAAFALETDWGVEDEVFTVTNEQFIKNSAAIFGYDYTHEKMKGLRELFRNAQTLYGYRLGERDSGAAASCEFGTAKYGGGRGNDLSVTVTVDSADSGRFTVQTLLDGAVADTQTVSAAAALRDNDFIAWDKNAVLSATAGTPLKGGENADIDVSCYQRFLDKIESCPVNAVGVCSENPAVNNLFAQFAVNVRDKIGVKLQCVVYNCAANHEGVVNVKNAVADSGASNPGKIQSVADLKINGRAERSITLGTIEIPLRGVISNVE